MMSKNESLKPPMMMKLKRKKFGNTQRLQCDPYIKQKKPDKKKYCHGDEVRDFVSKTWKQTEEL